MFNHFCTAHAILIKLKCSMYQNLRKNKTNQYFIDFCASFKLLRLPKQFFCPISIGSKHITKTYTHLHFLYWRNGGRPVCNNIYVCSIHFKVLALDEWNVWPICNSHSITVDTLSVDIMQLALIQHTLTFLTVDEWRLFILQLSML